MASVDLETEKKKWKKGSVRPTKTAAETGKGLLGTGGNALSAMRKLSMPAPLRSRMEGSFHADLSGLHLYENPSVERHGFEAVAQGGTIGFAPGHFRPETDAGRGVIGHEIAHVVSQARGESAGAGGRLLHSGMLERRADAEGGRAAAGLSVGGGTVHVGAGNSADAPAQGIIMKSDKMKTVNKAPYVREGVWKRGLDDMFLLREKLVEEAEKAPTGSAPARQSGRVRTGKRDRLDTATGVLDPVTSSVSSTSSVMSAVSKVSKFAPHVKGLGDSLGVVTSGISVGTDLYDLSEDPSWQGVLSLISNSGKFLTGISNIVGDVRDAISGAGVSDVTGIGKLVPGLQSVFGLLDVAVGIGNMAEQGKARENAKKFVVTMKAKATAAGIDLEAPKGAITKELMGLRHDADETAAVAGRMKSALFHVGKRFNFDPSDAAVGDKYRELKSALSAAHGSAGSAKTDYSAKNRAFRTAAASVTASGRQRAAHQAERDKLANMQRIRDERRQAVDQAETHVAKSKASRDLAKKRRDKVASAFLTEGIDLDAVAKDKREDFHPMSKLQIVYEHKKAAEESKAAAAQSQPGTASLPPTDTTFGALMPAFSGVMAFYINYESKNEDVWSFYSHFETAESGLTQAEAMLENARRSLAAQEAILSSHTAATEAMPRKSDTEHEALTSEEELRRGENRTAQQKLMDTLESFKKAQLDFEFFKSSFEQGYPGGIDDSNADKMVRTKDTAEASAKTKKISYDSAMQKAPLAFEKFASTVRMGDLMKKKAGQEMFGAGVDVLKGVCDTAAGILDVTGVASWIGACVSAFSAALSVSKMIAEHVQKRMRIGMNLTQTMEARRRYVTAALSSSAEGVDKTDPSEMTDEQKAAEKEKLRANAGFSHLGRYSGASDELTKLDQIIQDIIDEAYTAFNAEEIEQARKAGKSDQEIAKIAHVTREGKRAHGRDTTRLFKRLICFEMGSPKGKRAELSDIAIYRNAANMLIDAAKEAGGPGEVKAWRDAMKADKKQTAVADPGADKMPGIQMLLDLGALKNRWEPLPSLKDVAGKMGAERKDYRNLIKNPAVRVFPELVRWRADVGAKFGHFDESDEEVAAHKDQFLSGYGRDIGTGKSAYAQQHMRGMGARRLAGDMFGDRNAVV